MKIGFLQFLISYFLNLYTLNKNTKLSDKNFKTPKCPSLERKKYLTLPFAIISSLFMVIFRSLTQIRLFPLLHHLNIFWELVRGAVGATSEET